MLASLVLHLLLWPAADRILAYEWASLPIPTGEVMEVALLPSDLSAPAPEEDEDDAARKEEAEEERKPPIPDGRLVHLDALEQEARPDDARFLSEFDSKVEREQRAPTGRPVPPPAGEQGRGRRSGTPSRPAAARPKVPAAPAIPLRPSRSVAHAPGAAEAMDAARTDAGRFAARAGGAPAPAGAEGLRGTPDLLRRSVGTPGTYDDLRDVEEGDATLLNSRRWKYASFFNRVRDMVARQWHPAEVHRARDPDGSVYGTTTRTTILGLSLLPDGSLGKVVLLRPSGAEHLDEEAIRAVRAAAPFPNPPSGLVDPHSGRIEFTFGFVFEIGGRGRIFRYRR